MKQLLILVGIGVVIVTGGVIAGLYNLDSDSIAVLTSDVVVTKRIETGDGSTAFVEPPPADEEALFVQLQPVDVPIFDGDRVAGGAKLVVTIELVSKNARPDLNEVMPLLLAQIFEDFYRTPLERDAATGKLDVIAIERRIEAIAIKTVGVDAFNRNIVRSAQLLKVVKHSS